MKQANIEPLVSWYDTASPELRQLLADEIGCSKDYLYLLRSGIRGITPAYAILIESATRKIHKKFPLMPIIRQPQICHVCFNCPYTK